MKPEGRPVIVSKPQAGPGRAWLELIYARSMQLTRPLFGVESHSTERGPPRLSHTMRKFGLSGVTPPSKARKTMETAQRRRRKGRRTRICSGVSSSSQRSLTRHLAGDLQYSRIPEMLVFRCEDGGSMMAGE